MASSRPSLFPSQPHAHVRHCDSFGGSRVYDYNMKYPPDKQGEEHTENARVWNVYLDEIESHDRDLLQGFRDIIDGVLVFSSLFSAVVTTLVAQTSQVLQPDNTRIMASILFETNQLLRAAGNVTAINAIPKSTLSPGSVVNTSKDVWVNGLFFTSLGLSLSTALLTVLVKQWLHAYSSFITGDARRRAFITYLRSEGLRIWRVREIVEALPLILHGSVLIFFVGLVLYVSQLSAPICAILAIITSLAFIFYVGTSILPFVFIACPYRILFFFDVCESIAYCIRFLRKYLVWARAFIRAQLWSVYESNNIRSPYKRSLDSAELRVIEAHPHITLYILQQLLQTSDQHSTRQIVLEAAFAILRQYELPRERRCQQLYYLSEPFGHTLMEEIFRLSLAELTLLNESRDNGDGHLENIWESRIVSLNEHIKIARCKKIQHLLLAYRAADLQGNRHTCERILDWIGKPALEDANNESALLEVMMSSTGNGIRQILKRSGTTILSKLLRWHGTPLLHYYAQYGNLDQVKAVVETDGSDDVVNQIGLSGWTPLEGALKCKRHDIVSYLMDHGGRVRERLYEAAFFNGIDNSSWDLIRLLWRRRREVRIVDPRPDSWCRKSATEVANDSSRWEVRELTESKRRKLIEILQECGEIDVQDSEGHRARHLSSVDFS